MNVALPKQSFIASFRRTGRAFALLAMMAIMTAGWAAAQDVCYVATGGDDASDGQTPFSAKRTIVACLAAPFVDDGDIVSIEAGPYGEPHLTVTEAIIFEARQTGGFTTVDVENGFRIGSDVTFRANTVGGFSDGVFRLGATSLGDALVLTDGSLTISDPVAGGRLRIADGGRVTRDDDVAVTGTVTYLGAANVHYIDDDGSNTDVTASGELPADLATGELNVDLGGGNTLTLPASVTGVGHLVAAANSNVTGTVAVADDLTIDGPGNVGTLDVDDGIVTVASSFESNGISIDDNPLISFDLGGLTITNGGDFIRLGGAFNSGGGNITFVGATDNTFAAGPNFQIGGLSVDKNGATLTITDDLELTASGVPAYVAEIGTTVAIASAATLTIGGNWDNRGDFLPGTGALVFDGTGPQSILGAQSFYDVHINKPAGDLLLFGSVAIGGMLQLTSGDLDLNGQIVTLGPGALLNETDGNTVKGTSGYIETTRFLNAPSGENVAGLGFEITSTADLGSTYIARSHDEQSVNGKASLLRSFDVSPTNNSGLSADLVFRYDESELNTLNEGALALYRSTDGGMSWTSEDGSVDAVANQIHLSGVDAFSRWTAAAPILVTNTNDGGPGSIRQAILDANARAGLDEIGFDIPGIGPHTIQPLSALPSITDPVVIDATTQQGFSGAPIVELDGSLAGPASSGLVVSGGSSTVRGFVINRFADAGIVLQSAGENLVQGNFIGTNVTGTSPLPNGDDGVRIHSANNTIGGTAAGAANVISGNGDIGVEVNGPDASGNKVQGNLIGTASDGSTAVKNSSHGILIVGATDAVIGASSPDGRNVISGNGAFGIEITGSSAQNAILGNFIGTDLTGTDAVPNEMGGVSLVDALTTIVGGELQLPNIPVVNPGSGNVISGNDGPGIHISGSDAQDNKIVANRIGTTDDGLADIPNQQGILIIDGFDNQIGGIDASWRNVVSGNTGAGIEIAGSASEVEVYNTFAGTDVTGDAPLPNDVGILITASGPDIYVGSPAPGARNIISGNTRAGVWLAGGANSVQIAGNYVGLGASGGELGNGEDGIFMTGTVGIVVGGSNSGYRNVISANIQNGIRIEGGAEGAVVQSNFVGTDPTGAVALGNGDAGISLAFVTGTRIGAENAWNVISGNGTSGVYVLNSTGTEIAGSFIGTGDGGMVAIPNAAAGIELEAASQSVIGGWFDAPDTPATTAGSRNVISGNGTNGIWIRGAGSTGNYVINNVIGLATTGFEVVGNGLAGIRITDAPSNTIGGTGPLMGNVISGNVAFGVSMAGAGATGNHVVGNLIGTDLSGTADLGNGGGGIEISGGAWNNTLGGAAAAERNVISGNGINPPPDFPTGIHGVVMSGAGTTGNVVIGNYIGTDASGASALGNGGDGVQITSGASANRIGGAAPGEGNVVSGNDVTGIAVLDAGTDGNVILGNLIGLNASGDAVIGHPLGSGVYIGPGVTGTTVGGTNPAEGNVISGNTGWAGIAVDGSIDGSIVGNYIGTDTSGTVAMGNLIGVRINGGATGNEVGGTATGAGNVIAYSIEDGIALSDGTGNSILSNSMYKNGELGIDLGDDGVTGNDGDDSDLGPNDAQNHPVLNVPVFAGGAVTVSGTLTSAGSTTYRVELFASESCDPSGHGEGREFLTSAVVTTDGAGTASFSVSIPTSGFLGPIFTATATDPAGNTSEFSRCPLPDVQAPNGYMYEVLADGFAEPQGLAVAGDGSLLVTTVGSGEIFRIDMVGARERIAYGLSRPVDVAIDGSTAYVTDLDFNGIYAIDLSAIPPGGFEVNVGAPVVSGLNGPTHLEIGPDGSMYVSEVRGSGNDRVSLVDLGSASWNPIITFSGDVNPQGKAFRGDEMYVAYQKPGEVRSMTPVISPVDGSTLPVVLQNLDSPGGLDFGLGDRLYVAERWSVALARPDETDWTPFLTGLSGGEFNNVFVTGSGVLYAADYAGGRIIRVAAPVSQALSSGHLAYRINAGGNPTITDGSDVAAIQNAFQHWEDVATSAITFAYLGTSPLEKASANDGVNLVTFKDTDFLFSSGVLAVAAKTIVFADDGESGEIVDADMIFNPDYVATSGLRIGTDSSPGEYDIEGIATHEAGHMVGLKHSGVPHATMFFVLPSGTKARTLELDDRAWISQAYPDPSFTTGFGAIEGTVYDGDNPGATVAGGLVIALEDGSSTEAVHAYTSEDGFYHVPGLPSGKNYRVLLRPLNGAVFGTNLQPGHVSRRMHDMTTKTDYPGEWYNGTNEVSDPSIDDPSAFTAVAVNSVASGIDFYTNLDETPPSITGISPKDGASAVPTITQVVVAFSERIDPVTFEANFTLASSAGPVSGSTIYIDDKTAVFTPDAELAHSTLYTVEISPGVEDFKGNASTQTFSSSFMTRDPDTTPPTVTAVEPSNGAAEVFITSNVTAAFSEPVDPNSVTASSFQVLLGTTAVGGQLTFEQNNTVVVFDPDPSLLEGQTYTVDLTAEVKDGSGNALAPTTSSFQTVAQADPIIEFIGPEHGATGITVETPVLIDFSEPINTSAFAGYFTLKDAGGDDVVGTFEFLLLNSRVVFRPSARLDFGETYTVTVTAGVPDVSSSVGTLQQTSVTSFTTATEILNPSITFVSPPSAEIGSTVTIGGEGFDPDPSGNIVEFNGTTATVSASTLTSITTVVPEGATSGGLTVTVGQQTSSPFLFEIVTPLDLENAATAQTSIDGSAHDADLSPDGTRAYVTNASTNTVSVIDLVTTSQIGSIPVGAKPLKIAVHPSGTHAYVTNFDDHTLSVIDLTTDPNQVVATLQVGLNPSGVAVTPDGSRVYVAGYTSRTITVIDADPTSGGYNNATAQTSTDGTNSDIDFAPDGTLAFVAGSAGITVLSTDPASDTYNSAIAETSTDGSASSVDFSPDGAFAVVVTSDGKILILDANPNSTAPFQAIAQTSTDGSTSDADFSPDGTLILATNFDSGTVSVLELSFTDEPDPIAARAKESSDPQPVTGITVVVTEIATLDVGDGPEGIVLDPNTNTIVVANSLSNDVSIIKFSLTPEEQIYFLINSVNGLVDNGALNRGHGQTLLAKLEQAIRHLDQGKPDKAVKKLRDFIKQVHRHVDKGRLDASVGDDFVSQAEALIDELSGSLSKSGAVLEEELPETYDLGQNYPNPFNPSTTIEYQIPGDVVGSVHVLLEIYNVLGQRVAVLVNEEKSAGRHQAVWDGRSAMGAEAASGLYLFRIEAGDFQQVRKMTLVR